WTCPPEGAALREGLCPRAPAHVSLCEPRVPRSPPPTPRRAKKPRTSTAPPLSLWAYTLSHGSQRIAKQLTCLTPSTHRLASGYQLKSPLRGSPNFSKKWEIPTFASGQLVFKIPAPGGGAVKAGPSACAFPPRQSTELASGGDSATRTKR
ncbi:MAG: hypothetical protein ACI8W8_001968, partial [Rhodothermales bacterium]